MSVKISSTIAASFAALALMSPLGALACDTCGPTTPPKNGTPTASGTGIGTGIGTGVGTGTGISSSDAAAAANSGAVAKNGDVTGTQKMVGGDQTATQLQKGGDQTTAVGVKGGDQKMVGGDQTAVLKGGDQKMVGGDQKMVGGNVTSDNKLAAQTGEQTVNTPVSVDDHSVIDARSTAPVAVAAPNASFLAVPNNLPSVCSEFKAKEKASGGLGLQWDYNKSFGFQYRGGAELSIKPDQACLDALKQHELRLLNLRNQHDVDMQQRRNEAAMDRAVYSTGGAEGKAVILQKNYAPQISEIVKPGSDVQKLFGLFNKPAAAPAAAPAPAARKGYSAKPAAPKPADSMTISATGAAAVELAKQRCNGGCKPSAAASAAHN